MAIKYSQISKKGKGQIIEGMVQVLVERLKRWKILACVLSVALFLSLGLNVYMVDISVLVEGINTFIKSFGVTE